MTREEKMQLADEAQVLRIAIEKARFIHSEIQDGFFSIDPNAEEGTFKIVYSFPRYAAFCDILGDLLNELNSNIPSAEWAAEMKMEGQCDE